MVVIDTSALEARMDRAVRKFDLLLPAMVSIAGQGAAALRDGDTYQDRSGDLRKSTRVSIDGDDTVVLEMGESYAKYVIAHGYSNWEQIAETVEAEILLGIDFMVDGL